MAVVDFFTAEEKSQIVDSIKKAELNTSGEIRLHVEGKCSGDVLDSAAYWFKRLKMHETEARNGVLFYLAVDDHKFAIIGDAGIHAKVEEHFWDSVKEAVLVNFKEGKFAEGLSEGIEKAGEKLQVYFPYQKNDENELPDEISFGK
ncbi:MAG: TPM domain-containing protein [Mangrovibacterium sp.]